MANQAVGFAGLLAGGMLIASAITGASLPDVAKGKTGGPKPLGGTGTTDTAAGKIAGGGGGAKGAANAGTKQGSGNVKLAPNANRAGVGLSDKILAFSGRLADRIGGTLTIGTGTRHNRLTVNGNVSNHWDGNAVDIPAAGDRLTQLGQQALIEAGMNPSQAEKTTGGLFNINGWQVIFNTHEGGDHTNHLHVGYNP